MIPITLITMLAHGEGSPVFLGLLLGGYYFYQLFDAILTATAINRRALLGKEEEEFKVEEVPEALKSGSIFWGVVLMAIGGILLLANFEVMNYGSVFDFWPLVVIIIGLKLIFDYYSKSKQEN